MPAMSRVEAVLLRSGPWRAFASRILLPWALAGETVTGDVLEVGSGSGAVAAALLRREGDLRLTATDVDPAMVAALSRRLAPFGDRAVAAAADATELPFADGAFDAVVSLLMLHHTGAWERAVAELVRVVRPGGRVLGCDVLDRAALVHAERAFGTGSERLVGFEAFERELTRLPLAATTVRRSPGGLVFRFRLVRA